MDAKTDLGWRMLAVALAASIVAILLLFRHIEARRVRRQLEEDRETLGHAVESYKIHFDRTPYRLDDLLSRPAGTTRKAPPVLTALPLDPWGHAYRYDVWSELARFVAVGPDGKEHVLEWDVKPLADRLYHAKLVKVFADFDAIGASVERHRAAGGRAPRVFPSEVASVEDPWGNAYHYEPGLQGQDYMITCYGADGCPGGTGESQDITTRNREVFERVAASLVPAPRQ